LERRFQPVFVEEPSQEDTIRILYGLKPKFEEFHNVEYTPIAIEKAVQLSERYITDRHLPDKAIDVLDEAGSLVKLKAYQLPPELKELEEKIKEIEAQKETAVTEQDYEKAAKLRDEELKLRAKFENLKMKWKQEMLKHRPKVTEEDIAEVVARWTGIPVKRVHESDTQKLLHIEDELKKRVIGQDEAIKAVARAIRRSRVGLKGRHRPIGVFLFLGPTGVGKTETAKALAEYLFGTEEALIRFDMSEYMEKHTVSRLVGAPPGYVGYEEGGQLTEKVRRRPYSVLLFDEIEKAHPDVFNIFLQIFDDGRLTDAMGRTVDFSNTIIIMTSNLGARLIVHGGKMGFEQKFGVIDFEQMKRNVMEQVKRSFSPEFLNRLDEVIVYRALEKDDIMKILDLQIEEINKSLVDWNVRVKLHKSFSEWLIDKEYKPEYGARSIKRALQKHVEDLLAEELLKGSLQDVDVVEIRVKDDKPYIKPIKKKEKLEAVFSQESE
jgi:ATP-dependent Clp protease ATP-binding subunit ClpC